MSATSRLLKLAVKIMEKYADSKASYLNQSIFILIGVSRELINLIASEKHLDFAPYVKNILFTKTTLENNNRTLLELLTRLRVYMAGADPFSSSPMTKEQIIVASKVFDDCERWLPKIIDDLKKIMVRPEFDQIRRHMNDLETKVHDAKQWLERSKLM